MKLRFCRMHEVPISLKLTTRNLFVAKLVALEKEIDLIGDENQKVNNWNVLMDDFRIALNFAEELGLLPDYQIAKFRNQADKLEKKGDAAMDKLHPLISKEFAPY